MYITWCVSVRAGLSLGSSKHWRDALEEMTGERNLDVSAMMEYFEPLMKYLKEEKRQATEETNQTVPIVVGSILGVLLVAGITFYGYKRCKQR